MEDYCILIRGRHSAERGDQTSYHAGKFDCSIHTKLNRSGINSCSVMKLDPFAEIKGVGQAIR